MTDAPRGSARQAPQGTAIRPLKVGGSGVRSYDRSHLADMPAALEAGTIERPGIAGLGAAPQLAGVAGMDCCAAGQALLKRHDGVRNLPG